MPTSKKSRFAFFLYFLCHACSFVSAMLNRPWTEPIPPKDSKPTHLHHLASYSIDKYLKDYSPELTDLSINMPPSIEGVGPFKNKATFLKAVSLKQYLSLLIQHFSHDVPHYLQHPICRYNPNITCFHHCHNLASSIKQLKKFDSQLVGALNAFDILLKRFYKEQDMDIGLLPSSYYGDILCNAFSLANIGINLCRNSYYNDLKGSYIISFFNLIDFFTLKVLTEVAIRQPYIVRLLSRLIKILQEKTPFHKYILIEKNVKKCSNQLSKKDILAVCITLANGLLFAKRICGPGGFSINYLKNICLLRYMTYYPTIRKIQMGLNFAQLGLSIYQQRAQALSLRISLKAREIVNYAKQEQDKILARSHQLSWLGKALHDGKRFSTTCFPPSWQDENMMLPSDIGQLIWAFTYAKNRDYITVQKDNSLQLSFFNGKDDSLTMPLHHQQQSLYTYFSTILPCSAIALFGWSLYISYVRSHRSS